MCLRVGRMGRLSDDGPGHYNPDPSEGPWGGGVMTSKAVRNRVHGPTQCGTTAVTMRCTKGERKPDGCRCTPGAGLNRQQFGKTPPEKPAFQPYWGKPAVRNDRGIEETSASFEARSAPRSYPTTCGLKRYRVGAHREPLNVRFASATQLLRRGEPTLRANAQNRCAIARCAGSRG